MSFRTAFAHFAPSGVVKDLPPDMIDENVYNTADNIVFRDGIATRVIGYAEIYAGALFPPEYLLNVRDESNNYWIYAGQSQVAVTDGVDHFDITPVGGLQPTTDFNLWTGGLLNGIPVLNNPLNDPMFWDLNTANPMEYLPGWPSGTKCRTLRPFRYHLIALFIADGNGVFGDGLLWSDAADPGAIPQSWTPAPDNEAGSNTLSATPGVIVDGGAMRDQFVVFKNGSTYAFSYVGGNQIFAFRKVLETTGILGHNCAVEVKGLMIVLTEDDVVVFDGNQAKSILDGRNKLWLFNQIDPVSFANSFVVTNTLETEAWVCFPSNGNTTPNIALVWSKDTNAWGVRFLPNPAHIGRGLVAVNSGSPIYDGNTDIYDTVTGIYDGSNYTVASPSLLMADNANSKFYDVDNLNTNDGVNVVAHLVKKGLHLDTPDVRKLLKRGWPRIQCVVGTEVVIRTGGHDSPSEPVEWYDPQVFVIGVDEKIDTFSNGRYLAVEIASDGVQPWRLSGFGLEYSNAGRF